MSVESITTFLTNENVVERKRKRPCMVDTIVMNGPYDNMDPSQHRAITQQLISAHPLVGHDTQLLLDVLHEAWSLLWSSHIGPIPMTQLSISAQTIGNFFQCLIARVLHRRDGRWRLGANSKREKDLVFDPNPHFSIELKTSSSESFQVFGNRSYSNVSTRAQKKRSGYALTVNYDLNKRQLTLIRFGWLDVEDWVPQTASTGQNARLHSDAYRNKLMVIRGDYQLRICCGMVPGVGSKTRAKLHDAGIRSVGDLIDSSEHQQSERARRFCSQDFVYPGGVE